MSYVDGFVLPVPKKNLEEYRRIAREAGKIRASKAMPFDSKRMIYGGFEVFVDA